MPAKNAPATHRSAQQAPFTRWSRSIDGPELRLIRDNQGRIADWIELDVRDLLDRPDLLARLGAQTRARLLGDAHRLSGG